MRADRDVIGLLQTITKGSNQESVFGRRLISHCIGNVHDRRASFNHGIADGAQVVDLRPSRVFGRELDFIAEIPRAFDGLDRKIECFAAAFVELVLEVDIARREEGVDTRLGRAFQRLPAPIDIQRHRARQARDGDTSDFRRDFFHGLEVAFRSNRKSGFNDVDLKALELTGEPQLLFHVHAEAGSLFPVS